MSWIRGLNDSFEHFGGQISNFTKEVLAEDGQEVIDYQAEAERLKVSLIEAKTKLSEKEKEYLQKINENSALKQKSRHDELAINTLTHQLNQHKRLLGRDIDSKTSDNLNNYDDGFDDVILSEHENNQYTNQNEITQNEKEILQNKIKELELQLTNQHESYQSEINALKNAQKSEKKIFEEKVQNEREQQEEVYKREFAQLCNGIKQMVVEVKTEDNVTTDNILDQVTKFVEEFQSSIDSDAYLQSNLKQSSEEDDCHDNNTSMPISPSYKFNPRLIKPMYQSSPQVVRKLNLDSKLDNDSITQNQQQGDLTLTLEALQKQVDDYELEIAQYEEVQNAWFTEKQALQNMLDRYENIQTNTNHAAGENNEPVQVKESKDSDPRLQVIEQLKEELKSVVEVRGNMEKDKQRLLQEKDKLQSVVFNLEEELNVSMKVIEEVKDQKNNLLKDLNQISLEKNKLQSALKNVSDELNCSREERDGLNDAVESLDVQHQEEMMQIILIRDQLNNKIKELQDEKLSLQKAVDLANIEVKSKDEENFKLSETISSLEKMLTESNQVSGESVTLKFELKEKEDVNVQLKTELETLKIENEKLSQSLTEVRDKIWIFETSENNLKNNLATLENENLILKNSNSENLSSLTLVNDLKTKIQVLETENQGFQEKITTCDEKNLDSLNLVENLETNLATLENEKEILQQKINENCLISKTNIETLKIENQSLQEKITEFEEINFNSENLVKNLEELEKENKNLKEKTKVFEDESMKSKTLIKTLKSQLESMNEENDEISIKILEIETENEELVERLRTEVLSHTSELESAERRFLEMEESRRKLEEDQVTTKRKVEELKKEYLITLEKLEQEKMELKDLLEELKSPDVDPPKGECEDEEQHNDKHALVTIIEENKQQSSDNHLPDIVSNKEHEISRLNEQISLLQNEIKNNSIEAGNFKQENCALKNKISSKENELVMFSNKNQQLEKENFELQESKYNLEDTNLRFKAKIVDFETTTEKLKNDLKELNIENENENIFKFEKNVRELEDQVFEMNKTKELNSKLEQNLTELKSSNTHLNTDVTNSKAKNIELQEKLNYLNDQFIKNEEEKNELTKVVANLEENLKQKVTEIENLTNTHNLDSETYSKNLLEQITNLQNNLASAQESNNKLEQINQENGKLLVSKETTIKELEREIDSQSEIFVVLNEKITELQKSNSENILNFESEKVAQNALHMSQIETLSQKNQALISDISSLQDYRSKVANLESEIERLKNSTQTESRITNNVHEILEEIKDFGELEKTDLSKEDIGSLLEIIRERDAIITNLRAKLGNSNNTDDLEAKCKLLDDEKSQILSVVSEKTRENRQLKDELHKMMDSVAAGKTALLKVQTENQQMMEKYGGMDVEMTKETVTRLSNLISEKDLEIESLKLKCQTLLDVMQQDAKDGGGNQSVELAQIPALLRDRETMNQQIHQLLNERNHLVTLINAKQKEVLDWQEKASKVAESSDHDSAENCNLQIRYSNLVHDYEQIEMKLNNMKKELNRFKETANHLEETKEIILSKIEIDSVEQLKSTASNHEPPQTTTNGESLRSVSELESMLERKSESLLQKDILLTESRGQSKGEMAKNQKLLSDIREKDILLHQCKEEIKQITTELNQKTTKVSILKKSVENLREQVSNATKEAETMRVRINEIEKIKQEKENESLAFQETNAQLSVLLKEREYENETLKEKSSTLNLILKEHEKGKESESQKYLDELDRAKESAMNAKHERDQILLTLKQKQLESQRSGDETRQLRDKELKLQSELQRLRNHLLQVEETYTQEAMLSEERENQLRTRLNQLQNNQQSIKQEGLQTQQQVESLQEQLRSTIAKRDQAILDCQMAQEQSQKYAAALQQLQSAAERMQREEAATYAARVEKINQQYYATCQQAEAAVQQTAQLQAKLEEANIALESASRLNEQLEIKEQSIDNLKELVSEKQLELDELHDKLHEINSKTENMIDRQLVKNLFMGYFASPANKQNDVVRLISSVIGFSKEEEEKLHPDASKQGWTRGWLSWGRGGGSTPVTPTTSPRPQPDLNSSFTDMFVKFLENESTKMTPSAKLPTTLMVNESQRKMNQRKLAAEGIPTPAFNPPWSDVPTRSTVAGRYNPLLPPSTTAQGSHLLAPMTPILPTFTPVNKSSSEKNILQGILQSD